MCNKTSNMLSVYKSKEALSNGTVAITHQHDTSWWSACWDSLEEPRRNLTLSRESLGELAVPWCSFYTVLPCSKFNKWLALLGQGFGALWEVTIPVPFKLHCVTLLACYLHIANICAFNTQGKKMKLKFLLDNVFFDKLVIQFVAKGFFCNFFFYLLLAIGAAGHTKSLTVWLHRKQQPLVWSAMSKTATDESLWELKVTESWNDFFKVTQEVTGQGSIRAQLLSSDGSHLFCCCVALTRNLQHDWMDFFIQAVKCRSAVCTTERK